MPVVNRKVMYAPCGDCGDLVRRDNMHSMNVKFFTPDDRMVKVSIRLCEQCREAWARDLGEMKWSNESMEARDEPVLLDDEIA